MSEHEIKVLEEQWRLVVEKVRRGIIFPADLSSVLHKLLAGKKLIEEREKSIADSIEPGEDL